MKNIQNNNGKKKFRPMGKVWERPGRGHGSELFVFFCFSIVFCSLAKNLENTKKKFRPMGKVWAIHTQTKKPKKQKTKKPRNQKNKKTKKQKKKNKKKDCTPQGEGVRCRVLGLVFLVFCFFLVFWFFVFLVFCFFVFLFFVFLFFCFFAFLVFWFFGLCVDSHCRCAKQRLPGTVSGCTRSKVDTLQYSNVCYDIVHSANEQQRGMEFNFVRLRHMLLDLCTGNAAICALPQWPVLLKNHPKW